MEEVMAIRLNESPTNKDKLTWRLEPSGNFSTTSAYEMDRQMEELGEDMKTQRPKQMAISFVDSKTWSTINECREIQRHLHVDRKCQMCGKSERKSNTCPEGL